MTDEELDRLADAIARTLLDARAGEGARANRSTWLPVPVRPEPPQRGSEPPSWTGAAQQLGDVAPTRENMAPPAHRATIAELTAATRAAAAGKGEIRPARQRPSPAEPRTVGRRRGSAESAIEVSIGVSNRHVHLSPEHVRLLFGVPDLSVERTLSQPGQFAARERVSVTGPAGTLERVRVVGPARGQTQLELAPSDCRAIGVQPPYRPSGELADSAGGVTLTGPAGSVRLDSGVIIATRHLHLSADDARRLGLANGGLLDVRCGADARAITLHEVLVRAGGNYATELHLDVDEAFAAGVRSGDKAMIITWRSAPGSKRSLITERDVIAYARDGRSLPKGAILTPSARDRARALRLLVE